MSAELAAEQTHLAAARAALVRMRADTADYETAIAGDSVSTAYLKQQLYRRMRSLEISPDVPLFFGRIDYAADLGAEFDETCHIGRRHITAAVGTAPLVMDWRAPMARPFYQARSGDDSGVRLRRRFGFAHGQLTAFEDEDLAGPPGGAQTSDLLEAEIERPRSGPMRDIVATIQPDQDVLVRADLADSLCIQGAPGTGKTAVGLHRAAYLLYAFRQQLSRSGVMVVGPNASFLTYISDVLPALGEIDVRQETMESLVGAATGLEIRGAGEPAVETLKGDVRMAAVLRRALWAGLGTPTETLVVQIGHRRWRVPAGAVTAAMAALSGPDARYATGRELLPQRIAHLVLQRMEEAGEITDDRVQAAVARSQPVKALVKQVWPEVKAPALVHRLLTDAGFLAAVAGDDLDPVEQALLVGVRPARTPRAMKWTLADLVLVDEVGDLLTRTPGLGHVIIDEAQDLSPMQLRAVGRRAATGSVTLLGDLAQATTPWATRAWPESLAALGKPETEVRELVDGFRVPGSVIDYAARLLPVIAPGLSRPRSIRRSRGDLEVVSTRRLVPDVVAAAIDVLQREGTVGVIVPGGLVSKIDGALAVPHDVLGREAPSSPTDAPDAPDTAAPGTDADASGVGDPADVRLVVVPAELAKGLEFDHVVLAEPAAIVAAEPDRTTGLRRLYVCLTRAVTSLTIVHAQPLPPELAEPRQA